MSVLLKRHAGVVLCTLEKVGDLDGQGRPAYDSPVLVSGFPIREQTVVRRSNGDEVQAVASVHCDAEQAVLPAENDRLTLPDGFVGIVVSRGDGRNVAGALDHVVVHLREE